MGPLVTNVLLIMLEILAQPVILVTTIQTMVLACLAH
jgi:hypothetical protein